MGGLTELTMASQDKELLVSINCALLKYTKAEEVKRDTMLMMQPYANWEEFLMPAPTSIAILGELIIISSTSDFPVNKHTPDRQYQHIKYPESFRACLMQVSNQGWKAFNLAHKNMDQIRLHSQSVPVHMKNTVKTLMEGNQQAIEKLLPLQLGSIKTAAEECLGLAQEVEKDFTSITDLIHELLEACTSAKGGYEGESKEVQLSLEEAKLRKITAEKEKRNVEDYFTRMTKEVEEAHDAYKNTVESAPSEWGVMGMFAMENSINLVSNLVTGFMSMVTADPVSVSTAVVETVANIGNVIAEKVKNKNQLNPSPQEAELDPVAASNVLSKSSNLLIATVKLQDLLSEDAKISLNKLLDRTTGRVNSEVSRHMFQTIKTEINLEEDCNPKQAALTLCRKGIAICEKLEEIGQSEDPSEEQMENVALRIGELYGKVVKFSAGCRFSSSSPVLPPSAPHLSKAAEVQDPEDKSMVQTIVIQARLKIENAKAHLDSTRAEYERSFQELKQSNKELDEILIMMRRCQVTEMDFNATLKMLAQGLDALGRVREQWTKMICFFEMVSNLIHVCLTKSLKQFTEHSEATQGITGYSQQKFIRDLIYTQAFQATNISNLIHMISNTYSEISSKYLMSRVTSLGRLITLDPADAEFHTERQQLRQGCDDARKMIMERVLSGKEEFESQVQQRIEAIDSGLKAVLPPPTEREVEAIESSLKQGPQSIFKEMSEEGDDQWA
ncbi:myosin-2 heavy chain-like isoform X1 [Heptranchias perlo]|uniref:myosin-2 heavy chain-like isoform X1 n=2 Tax=Heptranchias perlo TaxID=212740 RepID=UPI00355AC0E8